MKISRSLLVASLCGTIALSSSALLAEEGETSADAAAPAASDLPQSGMATGVVKLVKDGSKIASATVAGTKYGDIEVPESLRDKCKAFDGMQVRIKFEQKDGKLVASSAPMFLGPDFNKHKKK